jgi:hypothetical protein
MSTEIIIDVRDRRNKSASTSVRCSSDTEAQVVGFAESWLVAIGDLLNGAIRSAVAMLTVDISGLTGNVAADTSDCEEVGSFEFKTTNGVTKVDVNIPAILETLVDNDTGDMILASSAVAAFITMMEDGITAGGALITPCDVGGDLITTLNYARERSKNSGSNKGN